MCVKRTLHVRKRALFIWRKPPTLRKRAPYIAQEFVPYVCDSGVEKKPYISGKEPYISGKEPYISGQELIVVLSVPSVCDSCV